MRAPSAIRSRSSALRSRSASAPSARRAPSRRRRGRRRRRRARRLDEAGQRRARRGALELARVGPEAPLEHLGQRGEAGIDAAGLLGGERAGGRERDDRVDEIAERAADVPDQRLDLARLGAVDLVEDADHPLAGRVRQRQRVALGRLGGLTGGEDPDDGVGVAQEVARHPLVLGADRVQPRRVDDLDAPERLDREKDLDQAHLPRVGVAQRGQKCSDVHGAAMRAGRAVVMHDARLGRGAVTKDVDCRRRRRDAGGGDLGAGERVHERRLAGVELAHDGDQQRAIERLGGAARRRRQADQRAAWRWRSRAPSRAGPRAARRAAPAGAPARGDEPSARLVGRRAGRAPGGPSSLARPSRKADERRERRLDRAASAGERRRDPRRRARARRAPRAAAARRARSRARAASSACAPATVRVRRLARRRQARGSVGASAVVDSASATASSARSASRRSRTSAARSATSAGARASPSRSNASARATSGTAAAASAKTAGSAFSARAARVSHSEASRSPSRASTRP